MAGGDGYGFEHSESWTVEAFGAVLAVTVGNGAVSAWFIAEVACSADGACSLVYVVSLISHLADILYGRASRSFVSFLRREYSF